MDFSKIFRTVIIYWVPAILFAAFILFLSTRPDLKSGFPTQFDLVLRKIGHVTVYGIMTLLLIRVGLRKTMNLPVTTAVIVTSALGALMLALFDEHIQQSVPGRVGSLRDVVIDSVGIIFFSLFVLFFEIKKYMRRTKKA